MSFFSKIFSYLNLDSRKILVLYLFLWVGVDEILVNKLPRGFALPSALYVYQKNKSLLSSLSDSNMWSTTVGIVILTLSEIVLVSSLMFTITNLHRLTLSFRKCLGIVIFSHSVFLVQFISEFIFIKYHPTYFQEIHRDEFSLFSIQYFTTEFQISHYEFMNYLFQTISFFEILYWILLSYLFGKASHQNFLFGLKLVVSSYIPALFIWLLFVSLMLLINS